MKKIYEHPTLSICECETVTPISASNNLSGKIGGEDGGNINSGEPTGDIIGDSKGNPFGWSTDDDNDELK